MCVRLKKQSGSLADGFRIEEHPLCLYCFRFLWDRLRVRLWPLLAQAFLSAQTQNSRCTAAKHTAECFSKGTYLHAMGWLSDFSRLLSLSQGTTCAHLCTPPPAHSRMNPGGPCWPPPGLKPGGMPWLPLLLLKRPPRGPPCILCPWTVSKPVNDMVVCLPVIFQSHMAKLNSPCQDLRALRRHEGCCS